MNLSSDWSQSFKHAGYEVSDGSVKIPASLVDALKKLGFNVTNEAFGPKAFCAHFRVWIKDISPSYRESIIAGVDLSFFARLIECSSPDKWFISHEVVFVLCYFYTHRHEVTPGYVLSFGFHKRLADWIAGVCREMVSLRQDKHM